MNFVHRQDVSGSGKSCFLPEGLDTDGMLDMTKLTDRFRVYYDPKTGAVHDGNVYARQHAEQLAKEQTQ
jgi:hypothetical protein